MNNLAIIGAQWGDEGKGKIVNYFSQYYDYIVRTSGGANAGHTIYYNNKKYVHHLLPSIPFNSTAKGFLSKGMVIDLAQLVEELKTLELDFSGISKKFIVDIEAFLVLPFHKTEDEFLESLRENPIGTTKKGIGPAYQDKISRQNIRIVDLFDESLLKSKLSEYINLKNRIYDQSFSINLEETLNEILTSYKNLLDLGVVFTSSFALEKEFKSSSILFEGAQGIMLDLDSGTYPFVTSSQTTAYSSFTIDMDLGENDTVMGVVKAYTSRVGEGEFPTELFDEEAEKLRNLGSEFGATTGRNRRVGWIDLAQLRYAIKKSKINSIVITKGDILNGYEKVNICTGYSISGNIQKTPFTSNDFKSAVPIYYTMNGWKDIFDINFLKYITFIEKELNVPIDFISYGPKTNEIMSKNDFIMCI